MEQQPFGFQRNAFERGVSEGLFRHEAHDRPVVEIVPGFSVIHRAGYRLLEEDRVESDCHAELLLALNCVELHVPDLRVAGFEPEESVQPALFSISVLPIRLFPHRIFGAFAL